MNHSISVNLSDIRAISSQKHKKEVINKRDVVCTSCKKKLGQFIEVNPKLPDGRSFRNIFVCPCGEETFVFKTEYTGSLFSEENLVITSITDVGPDYFKITLENYNE